MERRVRDVALAVRLEGTEVVLEPGQQRDMTHRPRAPDGLQDVADHRAVDADVLRLGLLAGPGGDEDVRRPVPGEGVSQAGGVGQVGLDGYDATDLARAAPRQAEDLPARVDEEAGQGVSGDAGGADYKGGVRGGSSSLRG